MENDKQLSMTRQFKVTIEEISTVVKMKQGGYCVVEERLYTKEEIEKAKVSPMFGDREDKQVAKDIEEQANTWFPIKRIYGYAPQIPTSVDCNTKIYEQVVDELNIQKVITAVNTKD